jgi:hypothetical protein
MMQIALFWPKLLYPCPFEILEETLSVVSMTLLRLSICEGVACIMPCPLVYWRRLRLQIIYNLKVTSSDSPHPSNSVQYS